MNRLRVWLKASRLASQSTIALGLLFGQAMAWHQTGRFDPAIFALVHLYGLLDQLFIVYANDLADQEVDATNATFTLFSGGSRVLVDGELTPEALRRAASWMAGLAVGVGGVLGVGWGLWWTVPLIVLGLGLLWAYSFPPVALSYRGGGELLQMVGVGLVLPLIGYVAQAGSFEGFPWMLLAVALPLELTCAMCTALPDQPSDAAAGKRTTAVWMGVEGAQLAIFAVNLVALGAFPLVSWLPSGDARSYAFVAAPLLINLATLAVRRRARPGTPWMSAYVSLGLLVTMSWLATAIAALFGAWG